jgi:dihydrofolate reductase
MQIAIIAAIARNRVIGRAGHLPWHIPEDLARFKRLTTGHAVLMGRNTFGAIGRPLPGRRNVVVASTPVDGVESYPSPDAALTALSGEPVVFVIGGAALFERFLSRADRLYLTLVEEEPEGDTFFPPYEQLLGREFRLTFREAHPGFCFENYERIPRGKTM